MAIEQKIVRLQLMTTNRPLDVVKHWRDEGLLLLDTPYQRGDVWGMTRRVNLIKSFLMGVPIPPIIVNDRINSKWGWENWQYAVIDGKQRCTTFLRFLDSEIPVPGWWVGSEQSEIVFSELPIARQRGIKLGAIGFSEGQLESVEQEMEVFELINYGGVPQGESDIPE